MMWTVRFLLGIRTSAWRVPGQSLTPILPVALPVAAFGWAAWNRRWMSDDGFIYLRVVDQLLAGNGPVFNIGERVEIATSPLWVAMLTLAEALLRRCLWSGLRSSSGSSYP